ncbi:MAG: hypothetical protein RL497_1880 [Pseudomonadota bacterium]
MASICVTRQTGAGPRVLLLDAYDAPSHRYWRQGLVQHLTEFSFTCLTLPPRHFNWRIRGNPISWLHAPELSAQYEVILATSTVDLATLRGLVPSLARTPCIYYSHENQFAYPPSPHLENSPHQTRPLEPLMVNLYGALAADVLAFNSQWNLSSFLRGVEDLLKKMPDQVPAGIVEQLAAKACVLPVPLLPAEHSLKKPPPFNAENPLEIVWNHRWEFDKGPDLLLAIVEALPKGLPLRWHILGQQFRQQPAPFAAIKQRLEGQLGSWGFCEDKQVYQAILAQSHLVLSTAWHDFQGLAVLEAASLGAVPLVPQGLAYPEWFGAEYTYGTREAFTQRDVKALALSAAEILTAYAQGTRALAPAHTKQWQWPHLKRRYVALFGGNEVG